MTKRDKFFRDYTCGWSTTQINYSGYGYGAHCAGHVHIYGYDPSGETFDYIVTRQRAKVIKKMLHSGEWWSSEIDDDVRQNYVTNGHTTRVGLLRANANKKRVERCKQLAHSHQLIPEDGEEAHKARVMARNNRI